MNSSEELFVDKDINFLHENITIMIVKINRLILCGVKMRVPWQIIHCDCLLITNLNVFEVGFKFRKLK